MFQLWTLGSENHISRSKENSNSSHFFKTELSVGGKFTYNQAELKKQAKVSIDSLQDPIFPVCTHLQIEWQENTSR